jgi:hypothetical protein
MFLESSIKKFKSINNAENSCISTNNFDSIETSFMGYKDEREKTFTLPYTYGRDSPIKTKSTAGVHKTKIETNKGIMNFNNIRNEMLKKDKINNRASSKPLYDRNSKSPVLQRDNSIKIKLNPVHKTSNKESITPSEVSPKKELNNLHIVKPKPEDRKFSILDIMVCESKFD